MERGFLRRFAGMLVFGKPGRRFSENLKSPVNAF
jgi:hypothetical protein